MFRFILAILVSCAFVVTAEAQTTTPQTWDAANSKTALLTQAAPDSVTGINIRGARILGIEVYPVFAGLDAGTEAIDSLGVSLSFLTGTGSGVYTNGVAVDTLVIDSTSTENYVKAVRLWTKDNPSPGPIERILRDADIDPGMYQTMKIKVSVLDGNTADSSNVKINLRVLK